MHTALRPFSTAAIALTAATVVAVAPVTAPAPEVQALAFSSASVQLAASTFVDPITRWGEVLTTTQTNMQRIFNAASAQPFPVLTQVIANQTRYANSIGTALTSGAEGFFKFATGDAPGDLPALLGLAQAALARGDVEGAAHPVQSALLSLAVSLFPMLPILSIPGQITQNIANVAELIATQNGIIGKPAFGLISVAQNAVGVTGNIVQSLIDAVAAGDPVAAVSTIVNAPADFTDAMLNGQVIIRPAPWPPTRSTGILTPSGYTYWTPAEALLVKIPQAIAAAITPPTSPTPTVAPTTNSSVQLESAATSAPEPEPESEPTDAEPTAVSVSSNGATDLSAGNKAEPGKVGTISNRSRQQVRASIETVANEVNKGLNDVRDGIEKSVTGMKDRISKKPTTAGKTGSSAKDAAGSSDSGSDS